MTRSLLRCAFASVCIALLQSCAASPTSNYYLLTAGEFPDPTGGPLATNTLSLGVGPVSVPPYLERDNMVYRQQGNTLQIAAYDKWAEPLADGITRVMSLNLAQALAANVRAFPWHASSAPDYALSIDVLELDIDGQRALLSADWRLYQPDTGANLVRRTSRIHTELPAGSTPMQAIPAAYSELLLALGTIIAEAFHAGKEAPGASR